MSLVTAAPPARLFIGLMSGTSLDGVDAVLVEASSAGIQQRATHFVPYAEPLRQTLLALHTPRLGELDVAAQTANQLAEVYANTVHSLLQQAGVSASAVTAIGCHGQTIRHCPELADGLAYTLQLGNLARLAELTDITVIGDFRSRDIAAGGQGAPLVPAFHQAVFGHPDQHRVILNIGGIANVSNLPPNARVTGFDTGPGNLLLDAWTQQHTGARYDAGGQWAAGGTVDSALLASLLSEPYFSWPVPKSTGRDLFNMHWLTTALNQVQITPQNVARTLLEFTIESILIALRQHCAGAQALYVCGGGVHNQALMQGLAERCGMPVASTEALGVGADWVEAVAFAWLAQRCVDGLPGNLPAVTGARGPRILGAMYPR